MVQVTPAPFLSLATEAVKVTVPPPSTFAADDVTVTDGFGLLPPHPNKKTAAHTTTPKRLNLFQNMKNPFLADG
jgi:hypothetical protein